jgi:hypothetical protein
LPNAGQVRSWRAHRTRLTVAGVCLGTIAVSAAAAAVVSRPANGRIAFVSRGGIYTIRADGSGLSKVAGGDANGDVIYRVVAWSPNGHRLAAVDARNLHVMRADGRGRKVVVRGIGWATAGVGQLAWSPRGDEIAVGRLAPRQIELIRIADGSRRVVVAGGAGPSWTPDGSAIVYWRQGHALPGSIVYDSVWEVRRDGSRDRRIADRAAMPALSPDGKLIAFSSEALYSDLRVMDTRGRHRRTLVRGSARGDVVYESPSWSPDGRYVVANREVGTRTGVACCEVGVTVVPHTGGRLRVIRRQAEEPSAAWQPVLR